jgi:hypothetical protein
MTKFIFILRIKELKPYQKRVKDMNQVLSMKSMHRYSLQDSSTQELELLKDVDMTHQKHERNMNVWKMSPEMEFPQAVPVFTVAGF